MKTERLVCGSLVVPGPDAPPIEGGAVLIKNGKIAAVDTKSRLLSSVAPEEVFDCGAHVLIPGMIDCHNHLSLDCALDNYLERMKDSESELTLRAVRTLRVDLESGVTTSRYMGDKYFLDVAVKTAVEEGRIAGPRPLIATRGIRAGHGHGFVGHGCDGTESIRKMVRENIKAGADLIKFYVTGTFPDKGRIACYYSRAEIEVFVEEAERVGLPTAVHCIGGRGLELCVAACVGSIEHGYFISDNEIELLQKSRTRLVVTPSEFLSDKPTLSPSRAAAFRAERDTVRERLRAVVQSGVFFAAGTDGMHGRLAEEAKHIVDAGASPADAFRAVTTNAAVVCGLDTMVGSLEVGKAADIVAVEGNPIEDIDALGRVKLVIKGGEIAFDKIAIDEADPLRR